ncbi:hypothetical protein BC943DRAFT_7819 [Umbelopsis sp. AD052]|nr:hypothetical protein BC943DRAFT_7819 [Umbelopsis sp. AD052]
MPTSNDINRPIPDVPKVPAPAQPSPLPPEPDAEPEIKLPPNVETPPDHLPQPTPPPQVLPPYRGIRATLKEIFESRNGSGSGSGQSPDKWDETCFQWCKQQQEARKDGKEPACKMVCFRRRVDQVVKESDEKPASPERWNPLRGYSIVIVDGKANCEDHVDDMNKSAMDRPKSSDKGPSVHEMDIGEQLEKIQSEGERLVVKTFTPVYMLSKRYIDSWTDGTQAAFFDRFAESVKRADAYHIVRDNAKRVYENAFKNSKGNDKDDNEKGNKS